MDVRLEDRYNESNGAGSVSVPLYRPIQGWDVPSTLRRVSEEQTKDDWQPPFSRMPPGVPLIDIVIFYLILAMCWFSPEV